ncbi:hypothetical protein C4553_00295 [Candidatus Parcubacteria bacterium]|nr:MAG: hypothetical protein C4553_00295 [Candidatus Parcubacteria bacterium]
MSPNLRTNPAKLVAEIIEGLSPRLKEVVSLRFGLKDGRRQTLESIGQKYGITRERVRQIQNDAFKYLTTGAPASKIKPLIEALKDHIDAHGGVRKESTLLEADMAGSGSVDLTKPEQKAAVYLALHLGNYFNRHLESDQWHTFWGANKNALQVVKKISSGLEDHFESKKQVLSEDEVRDVAERLLSKQGSFRGSISDKTISAYLGLAKPIAKNIYGEYGLRRWPQISPVGVRDKAFLVFQKLKKPMHFTEVAKAINEAAFSNRQAHPQTVHNELIKDNRFVLIGRGMYALKDWGFVPGTVRDVLVNIMKKSNKPLAKEEILEEVARQRIVKPNTITLNLQNKNSFRKTTDGRYTLA